MEIGDLVLYLGRLYVLRGVDPMGLSERCAELDDIASGERIRVPIDDLEPAPEPQP